MRPTGFHPDRALSAASGVDPEAAWHVGVPWRRALVGVGIAIVVACAPPRASTPMEAYARLLDVLRVGELGTAMNALIAPEDVALQQRMERELRRTAQDLTEGFVSIEPVEDRIDGNWALVVTRVVRPREADTLVQVRDEFLYQQDGRWKLVPEALRSDSAVHPLVDESADRLFQWFREHRSELEQRYGGAPAPG
jgi:hypothetical protein